MDRKVQRQRPCFNTVRREFRLGRALSRLCLASSRWAIVAVFFLAGSADLRVFTAAFSRYHALRESSYGQAVWLRSVGFDVGSLSLAAFVLHHRSFPFRFACPPPPMATYLFCQRRNTCEPEEFGDVIADLDSDPDTPASSKDDSRLGEEAAVSPPQEKEGRLETLSTPSSSSR